MSIMFFMATVPDDHEAAVQAVRQLRRVYRNSTVLVCIDGPDKDQAFISAVRKHTVTVMGTGFNAFEAAMGGSLSQIMLERFLLNSNDSHLIKIDPDTAVLDDLPPVPEGKCLFGRKQSMMNCWSIQGGCLGVTRKAAQIICESAKLLSKKLRPPYEGLPKGYAHMMEMRRSQLGLSSFDWTLGWAATKLGIELVDWTKDICSLAKGPTPEHYGSGWSLIHPFNWPRDFSDG